MSATFVVTEPPSPTVIGFYALATGGVLPQDAPARVIKGVARHPVPVLVLARLAIDQRHQGRGLGRALLADCLRRTLAVSEEVGVRALLVHAKDDAARDFYLAQAEFEPSPLDPLQLLLLVKDLRRALEPR